MNASPSGWLVSITVAKAHLALFEAALDGLCDALQTGDVADGAIWRLAGYSSARPDTAELTVRLAVAAAAAGIAAPEADVRPVTDTDWVADYQARTGPVSCGVFFIRPGHVRSMVPGRAIAITLDAGLAFGTGEHQSTSGCLEAFEGLRRRNIGRVLDMGCGSGILSIAAAKLWKAWVLAVDSDPTAVGVAQDNIRINRVASLVTVTESEGFEAPAIVRRGPFDLIAANILAGPLIAMAGELAAHMAPRGTLVLSGLLRDQEREVAGACRKHGLAVSARIHKQDWSTLMLGRVANRLSGQR